MKYFFAWVYLLFAVQVYSQCSFDRFWSYYPYSNGGVVRTLALKDGGYLIYTAGFIDTIDYPNGEQYMVLIKVDSCGNTLWVNDDGYEGDGDDDMHAIETDSGDFLIVGYTAAGLPGAMGNIRVGKYNKNGQLVKDKLYWGNPISAPYSVIQIKNKTNRFLIYGYAYNIPSGTTKPLLIEIDDNLNLIRSKVFQFSEITNDAVDAGGIRNLLWKNDSTFLAIVGVGTSVFSNLYMLELDTLFIIRKNIKLTNDSIPALGFFTDNIFWNKDSTAIEGAGRVQFKGMPFVEEAFMRMDLNGKVTHVTYLQDTLPYTTCLSQTKDGGYIAGPYLQKLDSNFNTEWIQQTKGQLYDVHQLQNGTYIGSGRSNARTLQPDGNYYDEVYFVKTDSAGSINRTGLKEQYATKFNRYVYPNPSTTGIFTLSGTHTQPYTVKVTDATGKQILYTTIYNGTIDLSGKPNGMYYVRIEDVDGKVMLGQSVLLVD
jgi:hypothetical protein